MRPTFHPSLVNGPFGDPAVLVRILGDARNLLFDLGDLHRLPAKPVLKTTHAFVSHAHMDHFCGLDTVVRYSLGRGRTFRLVGPPGIADRVESKLGGYTWNLVHNYGEAFCVEVLEYGHAANQLWCFPCREGFARHSKEFQPATSDSGTLREVHREAAFRVVATELDHRVASLAYAVEESLHVNVAANTLVHMGLRPGPWLRRAKQAVHEHRDPDTPVTTDDGQVLPLGKLLEQGAIRIGAGQRLAYVADCIWRSPTVERAVELARNSHLLYCEAAFLEADRDRARERYHLTAAQAGELARRAGVGELRIFHFSPKYKGRQDELLAEAGEAFGGPVGTGP